MPSHSIRVTGLVQGVFFRDRTKAKAEELGVTGWVKNTEDGAVEIHAEGAEESLKMLEEWCKTGPPKARIEAVEIGETKDEHRESFQIYW